MCWLPLVFFSDSLKMSNIFVSLLVGVVGAGGPSLAAIILTYLQNGREGVLNLLKRLVLWRVNAKWYLVVLFLLPALMVLAILLNAVLGGKIGSMPFFGQWYWPIILPLGFLLAIIMGGPLEEEMGWRGYALPRLQSTLNPLYASIIIGIIWGAWHLPLFLIPGTSQYSLSMAFFLPFADLLMADSIIMTWVYNNTKGSILMAILSHATKNIGYALLPLMTVLPGDIRAAAIYMALVWIISIAVIAMNWKVFVTSHPMLIRNENVAI